MSARGHPEETEKCIIEKARGTTDVSAPNHGDQGLDESQAIGSWGPLWRGGGFDQQYTSLV